MFWCWMYDRSRDRDDRDVGRPPRPEPSTMRASDADRQRAIERLRVHTVDGRLTLEEFESRVVEVLDAKTHAELSQAFRELPESRSPAGRPTPPPPRSRPGVPAPVLVVLLVVIGSVLMRHFAFWLIPVGFFLFNSWGRGTHSVPT